MMSPSPEEVRRLFDANATTYDRVNSVISLGLDRSWRDWAAHEAVSRPGVRVLDAFAGTGLTGLREAKLGGCVTLADVSGKMLDVASRRARSRHLDVRVAKTDLAATPTILPGAPYHAITAVFGMRYLDRPSEVVKRLSRLLRPGGRFVIVDFVEPDGGPLSRLASAYFFRILPALASRLAGHAELYERLTETTHAMGRPEHLERLVSDAGLEIAETHIMGFGLVVGIVAQRPPREHKRRRK